MVRKPQRLLCLKLWKCPYLNLQNKDFIVKHAIVILRLNLILSMITISNKTKLAVLNKAQECRSQNLSLSHA